MHLDAEVATPLRAALKRATSIRIVPWQECYRDKAMVIGREMHTNSIYHDIPFDPEKTARQLAMCGNEVPDRYFRLAVRKEEVLGGFYGHVRRTFFSDAMLAHDMGWWVRQTSRGSMAAILLLADFEQWAREQGARKVMVGQSTQIDIERTTKLFHHCGFRIIGFNTVKDL